MEEAQSEKINSLSVPIDSDVVEYIAFLRNTRWRDVNKLECVVGLAVHSRFLPESMTPVYK